MTRADTPRPDGLVVTRAAPRRALVLFVVVSFGLCWALAIPLWLSDDGLAAPLAGVLLPLLMLTPAAGAAVALASTRTSWRQAVRQLGLWPIRPVRRTLAWSAGGLVSAVVVVVVGVAAAAALGLLVMDLVDFSGYARSFDDLGMGELALPAGLLVGMQLLAIPLNAVVSAPFALGEEIGWRGWLLPALTPLGTGVALVASGAVWGLWHTPIILLGYNFDRAGADGVVLMVGACVAFGVLLGWLRLRTGSIWPPVFAHSAFNATAGLSALVADASDASDPAVTGPLGLVTTAVMVAIVVGLLLAGEMRNNRLTPIASS